MPRLLIFLFLGFLVACTSDTKAPVPEAQDNEEHAHRPNDETATEKQPHDAPQNHHSQTYIPTSNPHIDVRLACGISTFDTELSAMIGDLYLVFEGDSSKIDRVSNCLTVTENKHHEYQIPESVVASTFSQYGGEVRVYYVVQDANKDLVVYRAVQQKPTAAPWEYERIGTRSNGLFKPNRDAL